MSRNSLRITGHLCVMAFCVWHMTAVFAYALPGNPSNMVVDFVKNRVNPQTMKYLLWTSQWQQWNLFAPDPLRRVTYYHFSTLNDGVWKTRAVLRPGVYPWWRHALQFKMFVELIEPDDPNREPIVRTFLAIQCKELGIEPGARMKLTFVSYIVPYVEEPQSAAWWAEQDEQFYARSGPQIICPGADDRPVAAAL